MPRKERLPRNVSAYVDQHGKLRYRFRKAGHSTRYFKAHPNSVEGKAELKAMLERRPVAVDRYARGTVGWVAGRYYASAAFTGRKNVETAANSRRILEPFVSGFANDQLGDFRFDHIEAVLSKAAATRTVGKRKLGGPSASNNLRGELKPFFDYGFKLLDIEKKNPVEQAAPIAVPKRGFHSWSEGEIAQFRAHWPIGTKARLCVEIALWTWLRRGDVSTFGRKHLQGGKLQLVHSKTSKALGLPAAPQLIAAIEAMPVTGTETYLVTSFGKPFSKGGLGNKVREWCDQAGLPHCTLHGLRKAGARRAAELQASNQMLKAVGGWSGDQEVALYTASADQVRLAELTLNALIEFDLANRGRTK
jgi:integrase